MPAEYVEKCGVGGVFQNSVIASKTNAAFLAYLGALALQDRGRDSSGIDVLDGNIRQTIKGLGLVRQIYNPAEIRKIPGDQAIFHNRYATNEGDGSGDDLDHVQPICFENDLISFAHNGNIPNLERLERTLTEREIRHSGLNDSGMLGAVIADNIRRGMDLHQSIAETDQYYDGAVSAIVQMPGKMAAFRDRYGIRPLVIGQLSDGGVAFASETVALDRMGARYLRDVEAGESVLVEKINGNLVLTSSRFSPPTIGTLDIFEIVYFMNRLSLFHGVPIWQIRQDMGRALAEEHRFEADIVMGAPKTGIDAAIGYSLASGIPFHQGLKKDIEGRTFTMGEADRKKMDRPYIANPEIVAGKRVIVMEDSVVRGTTGPILIKELREQGAIWVGMLVHSDLVLYPDRMGINTRNKNELLAHGRTVEEMCRVIGADRLGFLPLKRMIEASRMPAKYFTSHVFDGIYPDSAKVEELAVA